MQAAFGVELARANLQSGSDNAWFRIIDINLAQEEFIDGTVGPSAFPDLVDLLKFRRHGEGGREEGFRSGKIPGVEKKKKETEGGERELSELGIK